MADKIRPTDTSQIEVANLAATPAEPGEFDIDAGEPWLQQPRNPDGTFAPTATVSNAEPAPAAPATPKHPRWLTDQAMDFGFSEDEIASLSSDALGIAIRRLQLVQRQMAHVEATRVSLEQRPAAATPAAEPEEEIPLDFGTDENGAPVNVNDFHPGLLRAIKGVAKQTASKVKKLEAELATERQANQQRAQRDAVIAIDSAFAALGKPYEKLLGKGTGSSIKDKAEYQRRCAVLNAAGVSIHNVDASAAEKIKAAADMLFGAPATGDYADATVQAAAAAQAPTTPRITPEQWSAASTPRPTARSGAAEPKGDALAIKNLTERMRANGVPVEPGDQEITDGLL